MSAGRHQVTLAALGALDDDGRLALLVRRIDHHVTRQAGDFVHFFVQRQAVLQVLELHRAADFGEDREGVRIPLDHDIAERNLRALFDLDLGAVNHRVAFLFAALLVHHGDGTVAVHHHQEAFLGPYRDHVDEAHRAIVLGIQARLLADSRSRAADVEGTHGELRSRLADGLRRDNASGLAQLDQTASRQVTAVAHHANAALRLAGQHRTNLHPLDTGSLNCVRQVFRHLLVDVDDDVAFVVLDLLQRNAAHDAVAQRLDDLARLHDGSHVDAVDRAAIVFADDHVLGNVNQPASEVAGIRGLECGIGQALTSAVGRDEVLQHRESFAEVRGNWRLDDFARRLGHQAAHAGELTDLLFRSASAGVGHDVNRVHFAGLVLLLHVAEHFVGNLFGDRRPDFDDLVVALAVGDGAVQVLLLHVDGLLFGVATRASLALRDDHVVDPIDIPALVAYRKPSVLTPSSIRTVVSRPKRR